MGLERLRPGFCFTPEEDALLALGWPHLALVRDPSVDEVPPVAVLSTLRSLEFRPQILWPTRAAIGLARTWGEPVIFEGHLDQRALRDSARAALQNDAPITAREAERLLYTRMTTSTVGLSEQAVGTFCLLLEALVGTWPVAKAIVEVLEDLPTETLWSHWSLPPWLSFHLGYLLLRLPRAQHDALVERLGRVLVRATASAGPRPFGQRLSTHARSIHLVLGGARAALDSTDGDLRWYTHIQDDPELISRRLGRVLAWSPDARLIFLGGHRVLRQYGRDWKRRLVTREAQSWFLEQISVVRAPETALIALMLHQDSLVKDEALAFFQRRRAALIPLLQGLVQDQDENAWLAQTMLTRLGG